MYTPRGGGARVYRGGHLGRGAALGRPRPSGAPPSPNFSRIKFGTLPTFFRHDFDDPNFFGVNLSINK
jgi:hypothetical protein